MSEEALVSPLLDGFVLGAPMSERPGVSCHPAMKENSDQKYIEIGRASCRERV